jgi:hypothetical protein
VLGEDGRGVMTTYAVRRTNPRSKWPWRVVRTRAGGGSHKLLRKFLTREQAQAWLDKWTAAGLIDRLA